MTTLIEALKRAARELPEGYRLSVWIDGNGDAWVELHDNSFQKLVLITPGADGISTHCRGERRLCEDIEEALEFAKKPA